MRTTITIDEIRKVKTTTQVDDKGNSLVKTEPLIEVKNETPRSK